MMHDQKNIKLSIVMFYSNEQKYPNFEVISIVDSWWY